MNKWMLRNLIEAAFLRGEKVEFKWTGVHHEDARANRWYVVPKTDYSLAFPAGNIARWAWDEIFDLFEWRVYDHRVHLKEAVELAWKNGDRIECRSWQSVRADPSAEWHVYTVSTKARRLKFPYPFCRTEGEWLRAFDDFQWRIPGGDVDSYLANGRDAACHPARQVVLIGGVGDGEVVESVDNVVSLARVRHSAEFWRHIDADSGVQFNRHDHNVVKSDYFVKYFICFLGVYCIGVCNGAKPISVEEVIIHIAKSKVRPVVVPGELTEKTKWEEDHRLAELLKTKWMLFSTRPISAWEQSLLTK